MEPQGIFITTKPKEEALAIFDNFVQKYNNKHFSNIQQEVASYKAYYHEAAEIITACFASEMWGPQRCIRLLKFYQSNDNVDYLRKVSYDALAMLLGLRNIIDNSIPIKDFPSCKRLTELSVADAISHINDLGKNIIAKIVISAGLLGKGVADSIKITDIEQFYIDLICELNRELAEEQREMSAVEAFLMTKYHAELGYCHKARLKTGIGIAKEIIGIIKDADEAIRKHEEQMMHNNTTQLCYNK